MQTTRIVSRGLVAAVILALALGQQAPASAAIVAEPALLPPSPTPPPGCFATTHSYTQPTPQAIPDKDLNGITSTIHVSGLPPFTWNVTVQTAIPHTFSADLRVYLLAPDQPGFKNTLTSDNGIAAADVFSPTLWSDQAPLGVTEANLISHVNQPFLIPEGAMGAHYGHNPNGDWRLWVVDAGQGDTGTLNSWSLNVTTLPFEPPIRASQFPTDNTSHAIPNPGTLTATLNVSNAGPVLDNLTLRTSIAISDSGDLKLTLTSPTGLTTTLVNGNDLLGAFNGLANLFNGTLWTDDPVGGGPVTDANPVSGQPLDQVQPEGAMRHFAGSNPNGTWTLTITDMTGDALPQGFLNSWQLGIYTSRCDALYLPTVRR